MTPCHFVRYLCHRYQYINFFCVLPFDLLRDIQPLLVGCSRFQKLGTFVQFLLGLREGTTTCDDMQATVIHAFQ